MKVKLSLITSVLSLSAINVFAASDSPFGTNGVFYKLFTDMNNLISGAVIGLLIGITIALFFFALVRGMWRAQGGQDIKHNKDILIWGVAILFVMVSIWGIINFFQDAALGSKYKNNTIVLPRIPGTTNDNTSANTANPIGNVNAVGGTSIISPGNTCTAGQQCLGGTTCPSNGVCPSLGIMGGN